MSVTLSYLVLTLWAVLWTATTPNTLAAVLLAYGPLERTPYLPGRLWQQVRTTLP